jgi:hypothetical protein
MATDVRPGGFEKNSDGHMQVTICELPTIQVTTCIASKMVGLEIKADHLSLYR